MLGYIMNAYCVKLRILYNNNKNIKYKSSDGR